MSDPVVVANLLLAARERVSQGWCQKEAEDDSGNVCLLGAIGVMQGAYDDGYCYAANAVNDYLRQWGPELFKQDMFPSINYNDAPNRTKEEVMDLLTDVSAAVLSGKIGV